jgi:hypothetical protein
MGDLGKHFFLTKGRLKIDFMFKEYVPNSYVLYDQEQKNKAKDLNSLNFRPDQHQVKNVREIDHRCFNLSNLFKFQLKLLVQITTYLYENRMFTNKVNAALFGWIRKV